MSQTKVAVGMLDATGTPGSGNFLRGDGAWSAPAGAWTLIGTSDASADATVTVTGIDSTYDTYGIAISQMVPATDDVDFYMRFGDSSGVDSGASDYAYHGSGGRAGASTARTTYDDSAAQIAFKLTGDGIGNASGEGFSAMCWLLNPSDSGVHTSMTGTYWYLPGSTQGDGGSIGANHTSIIAHDRVSVLFSSGNVTTGRLTVWGIAHA